VCVCVCIYIYIYIYIYICMYVCMYVFIYLFIPVLCHIGCPVVNSHLSRNYHLLCQRALKHWIHVCQHCTIDSMPDPVFLLCLHCTNEDRYICSTRLTSVGKGMDFVICYFKVVRLQSTLTAVVLGGASVRTLARLLWCTLFMFQLKIALFMYCIRIFKFN